MAAARHRAWRQLSHGGHRPNAVRRRARPWTQTISGARRANNNDTATPGMSEARRHAKGGACSPAGCKSHSHCNGIFAGARPATPTARRRSLPGARRAAGTGHRAAKPRRDLLGAAVQAFPAAPRATALSMDRPAVVLPGPSSAQSGGQAASGHAGHLRQITFFVKWPIYLALRHGDPAVLAEHSCLALGRDGNFYPAILSRHSGDALLARHPATAPGHATPCGIRSPNAGPPPSDSGRHRRGRDRGAGSSAWMPAGPSQPVIRVLPDFVGFSRPARRRSRRAAKFPADHEA